MINLVLSVITFLLLLLQVSYPYSLSLFGVKPDFLLSLIIFLSLYSKEKRTFFWAVLLGGLKDILAADLFGINILGFSLISIIIMRFEARFFLREKSSTLFIMVFFVSLLNAIFIHILHIFFTPLAYPFSSVLRIVFLQAFFSAACAIVIIYILEKCVLKFFTSQL